MSSVFIQKAIGGKLVSQSDYGAALLKQHLLDHEGKLYDIQLTKTPVSNEMRGFYFGAVLPIVKSTCDEWKYLDSTEMHEVLRKMIYYFEAWNPKTKRTERFARSVMSNNDWNNTTKATEYLLLVEEYLKDCGRDWPNILEYKAAQNSAELR